MNKFSQLADDIDTDMAELDKDADSLNERRLQIKERARTVTNAHHANYDRVEGGLRRLEEAAGALAGRQNSDDKSSGEQKGNGEASGGTPGTSFQPETKS